MSNLSGVSTYRRARDRVGETVTFQRLAGDAPNTTVVAAAQVVAIVRNAMTGPPTGGFAGEYAVSRTERNLIVLEDDLDTQGFPLPLVKNDKVLVQGELMNIERIDPSKRGFAGAIDVMAIGVR